MSFNRKVEKRKEKEEKGLKGRGMVHKVVPLVSLLFFLVLFEALEWVSL